ncbi:MAG: HD domain-containing protein [Syntrophales bacterium]|nr:HD domain-containing protein [Syntrophales bacterium]
MVKKNTFIKDIKADDRIADFFICTEKNTSYNQKGNLYLSLRLRDKTGELEGKVWNDAEQLEKLFRKGDVVFVQGRAVRYRDSIQINVTHVRRAESEEVDPADYLKTVQDDRNIMMNEIMNYVAQISSPHLRRLAELIFTDEQTRNKFMNAPAAKSFHHSYIGGLLEHTLSVVRLVDIVSRHYKNISRDLLIAGALFHDIGKIQEFTYERIIDYSSEGRLIGHIIMGLEIIEGKIKEIEDFPEDLALELKHIIISHHGLLEFGSPKRPKTVEALIVHYMDDMDSKVKAFQESINDVKDEDSDWTPYHRLLERYIYRK